MSKQLTILINQTAHKIITKVDKYSIVECLNELIDEYRDRLCIHCMGSGNDGFDRQDPPNPYICPNCKGEGICDI